MRVLILSNSLVLHSWIALVDIGLMPVAGRAAGLDLNLFFTSSAVAAIGSLLAAAFGAFGITNDRHPPGTSFKVDLGADDEAAVAQSAPEESDWLLRDDEAATATARDLNQTLSGKAV